MTASTAAEPRNALATCCVAGKIDSTLQMPMTTTIATMRRAGGTPNVVRRRAATARIALGEPPLVAVERRS